MCPSCTRTINRTTWGRLPIQTIVEKALEKSLSFAANARIDGVIVEPVDPEPGKQLLQLTVNGSADVDEEAYDEFYEVPILIQGILCPECQNQKNQYFTGILQLRRPNESVQLEIERLLGKALTNVKDVTGGLDYYVSDHRILQNVARAVHNEFGGSLTVRAQHFSYDNLASKNLYRVNACLRLSKFWKGSVVEASTRLLLITNMGRLLKGIDLETSKVVSVPCHIEYPEVPLHETSIVTTRPQITVLDPETYQTVAISNQAHDIGEILPGAKVLVAAHEGNLYLVREVNV